MGLNNPSGVVSPEAFLPGGRLTLESGVPVSLADQAAKTSIFYTPYIHDKIPLYDGTVWQLIDFTETTLPVGTTTATRPHDVFAFISAGALALEHLVWTNDTTRATALATQDGVLIKSGAATRRYLGTFRTVSTTTVEDTMLKRFLWNFYNRVPRGSVSTVGTAHSLSSAAGLREWNAGTDAPRTELVLGHTTGISSGFLGRVVFTSAAFISANLRLSMDGAGIDDTVISFNEIEAVSTNGQLPFNGSQYTTIAEGYHIFSIFEINFSATSITVDQGYTKLEIFG